MRLVVDANILLSGIVRDALTRSLLLDGRLELYAPPNLLEEVRRHVLTDAEIHRKTRLGPKELLEIFERLLKPIRTIPRSELERREYSRNMDVALKLAAHPEDAPYLAAALTLRCAVWSNDSGMSRQKKVPVITTSGLLAELR